MSMQLFSFGHPCEHQLHRACIGGLNCPLNGYPDTWCCSFIKGKINFKRDRPCEGPRCHWDYVHPSQSQFDEVTQVLEQSRPIAAKLDEASDTDLLSFNISNPHIIDTVQCALHMMRHPPSVCARRVGQLLAYAALLAGDQDVFVQLLKTMKKPVDGYILGAYAFLRQGKTGHVGSAGKGGSGNGSGVKKQNKKKDGKEDITATLANIMVELMNAALSLGGQLVDREDQHVLQAMLIQALSTYPKSDKRHQEMLEKAVAKFGHRRLEDEEEAAAVKREAAKKETATTASMATSVAAPTVAATPLTTRQEPTETPAPTAVTATASAGSAASAIAAINESVDPATGEETTTVTASHVPAAATATAEAAAAPAAQAAAGVARIPSRSSFAAAAPGAAAADGSMRAAVPTVLPALAGDAVAMLTGTSSAAAAQLIGIATPKPTVSSIPGTPSRAAPSTPGATPGPITFSTAIQVQQHNVMPVPINALAGQVSAMGAPGLQATTASATPAASTPAPARTAIVGISKLHPYLAGRAANMRDEVPGLSPIYDPKSHSSGLFICGGQFTVEPLVWNYAPLGDAAANRRLDSPTREYMRIKEENRQRHREAREAQAARLAAIAAGNLASTSERFPNTFSINLADSEDFCGWNDPEWQGSSSDFSFD
ncbi:hypothetical protein conserved [Leishmania donovani]|uniref:Hypothetical_protein_conserved n=1 Tax=Leishmania donovani TaxID=5661 RepID=A0A6J8F3M0_LEIDO|nr:hypothetical protein conserved [Leishmania donovani]VDZ42170.1 hypothetical_protein_conserved [Leishmania donovani]